MVKISEEVQIAMLKAYKFRVYPTEEQKTLIHKTFGCTRFIYNRLLSDCQEEYKVNGKGKIHTPAKYKKEFEWLKEVDSMALCNAQMNVQSAYSHFFRRVKEGKKGKKVGFPKFKSKKYSRLSYTTNNINNSIRIESGKLRLPKLGFVKVVLHRYCEGMIKSVTVSQNAKGHYYVSILTDRKPSITEREVKDKEAVVGIDMSLSNCAVLSDGTKAKFQRYYRESERSLAKYQKRLSRKKKGSKNYEKARIRVAVIHDKIAQQRKDFLNKLSYRIAEKYDVAVVEDINLQAMSQCLRFGKSVHDAGFGMFRTMLEYKMKDRLKTFVKADKWFASSQLCSNCGYKNKETKNLSLREWVCPECGISHDRDVNAGKNLVNWYLSTVAQTGIHACGENTPTSSSDDASSFDEAGKVDKQDLSSPYLQVGVC